MNTRGFQVIAVRAGVANVRVREGNDLATVRRIRQNFLVPRHCSVEDHFANGLALGPDRGSAEYGSVL